MCFQVGEKVVYPNQGIGTIENISVRSFGSQTEKFYLLRLTYSAMTVMVPIGHAESIGLRRVSRNGELAKVLAFLGEASTQIRSDWKCRYKENTEKMRVGGLLQIAEVLKCLLLQQQEKALSFREKKMLDRARYMLVSELSISREMSEREAAGLLQKPLARLGLVLPPAL